MKRVQQKEPEGENPPQKKKQELLIEPVTKDRLGVAVRDACRRYENDTMSNQPLLIYAHDLNSETPQTYAYWPANQALGRRVIEDLDNPMIEFEEGEDGNEDETLLVALISIADGEHFYDRRLCRTLGLESVEELGILRLVIGEGHKSTPDRVSRSLLHPQLFQIEVFYD